MNNREMRVRQGPKCDCRIRLSTAKAADNGRNKSPKSFELMKECKSIEVTGIAQKEIRQA
jgi:hypothetical protein